MPYGLISPFGNFNGGAWNFNGPITLPAGTAAAPSINFGSSGLYQVTTNALGFSLAGAAAMQLTVAGGNATFTATTGSSSSNGFNFYGGNTGLAATLDSNKGLTIRAGGLSLSTAGNTVANAGELRMEGTGTHGGYTKIIGGESVLVTLSGATTTVGTNMIPAGCILVNVAAIVTTTITGATTWSIGDGSTATAFGSAIALTAGTTTSIANWTLTSAPVYTTNHNIVITANGANFTGGVVRVFISYIMGGAPGS